MLVTGSAGHLGEALVRTLRDLKHEVVGLDVLESPFTTHVGSIIDRACVRRCINFRQVLDRLRAGDDLRSPLAQIIGSKGYHAATFSEGPYPVA